MNILSRLVVTAAVVGGVGGSTPVLASGGEPSRTPIRPIRTGRSSRHGRIHRQLRPGPRRQARRRRHRERRRPPHRHRHHRSVRQVHVRVAAGGRLPGARPSNRVRPGEQSARAGSARRRHGLVLRAEGAARCVPRADPEGTAAQVYAAGFVGEEPTLRPTSDGARRRRRRRSRRSRVAHPPHEAQRAEGRHRCRPSSTMAAATASTTAAARSIRWPRPTSLIRTGDVMARMAASLLTDFPLVGQLNLLTTGRSTARSN